jgi:hypothetical protein
MKIELTKPDGTPYMTLRKDENLAYIQLHDYTKIIRGHSVELNFDHRAIPMLIQGLTMLHKDAQ